jgi:hypothetical protein
MEMKPGEIVDKWTILRMKLRAKPDDRSILGSCIAHGTATDQIVSVGDPNILDLVEINAKIWVLESMLHKIRVMAIPDLQLTGAIAIEITSLNKIRQGAIARINDIGELNAKAEDKIEDLKAGVGKVEI